MAPPPLPTWTPPTPTAYQRFRRDPPYFMAQWLHSRRPPPRPPPRNVPVHDNDTNNDNNKIIIINDHLDPLTVVCLSDTHNTRPPVPDGDLLLHAGDLTEGGSFQELQDQLDWLSSLPHAHKVLIAGNHDRLLDADFVARFPDKICEEPGASGADLDWHGMTYLDHASTTVRFANGRTLRIFGSPRTPLCGTFAFQYPPIRDVWAGAVPPGTDVLLTHGPPRGYLDLDGKGCPHLLREMARTRPALVVFGHIHAGHGVREVSYRGLERGYQRAMAGEGSWAVVLAMMFWLLVSWVRALVAVALLPFGASSSSRKQRTNTAATATTTMVNAAVGGRNDRQQYPATVLQI
ncbi:hypothetical protein E4U41_005083 [Claviceps citrina]|nr:hypothetical protein E4U41_005083 [Claviceps citrina]